MTAGWKVYGWALATTLAIAYIACAIFDAVFPPYGMLVAFGPHSPWPIYGSPVGLLSGLVTFVVAGFVLGAVYGFAWEFWSKRLS
jgi:hypothetical protein